MVVKKRFVLSVFLIIDEYAFIIGELGFYRIFMHIMLTLAEMVIFKIVYMYKFSVIAASEWQNQDFSDYVYMIFIESAYEICWYGCKLWFIFV